MPEKAIIVGILGLLLVGLYGLLTQRHLIKLVLCVQIVIRSAFLLIALAGNLTGKIELAQSMIIVALMADTILTVLALSMLVQTNKQTGTLDVKQLSTLRK